MLLVDPANILSQKSQTYPVERKKQNGFPYKNGTYVDLETTRIKKQTKEQNEIDSIPTDQPNRTHVVKAYKRCAECYGTRWCDFTEKQRRSPESRGAPSSRAGGSSEADRPSLPLLEKELGLVRTCVRPPSRRCPRDSLHPLRHAPHGATNCWA